MPKVQTFNPATGQLLAEYAYTTNKQLQGTIGQSAKAFRANRAASLQERAAAMLRMARLLEQNRGQYALAMTREMGKLLKDAEAEVDKCKLLCEHYAAHAEEYLADTPLGENPHKQAFVSYEPLGTILAIMPWNFPFWQVFRCVVPAIMAGNSVVLKHAGNVTGSALLVGDLFRQAGLHEAVLQVVVIQHDQLEHLMKAPEVQGVSLTGSTAAGKSVASLAGKHLKKQVLELGGSDPFIVLPDADLEQTATAAVEARTLNNGQSCIAAKRFIVHSEVYNDFLKLCRAKYQALKVGNPEKEGTDIGPLARKDLQEDLAQQVEKSVKMGAKRVTGAKKVEGEGYFFEPGILEQIPENAPALREELFGPVASYFRFSRMEQAIELANNSPFGLGGSIWTADGQKAIEWARQIESGVVYVNSIVRSHPALPFGGVKESGYGRELSHFGIREFTNIKCIALG